MILVVDSDAVMRGCVARICESVRREARAKNVGRACVSTKQEVRECDNAIEAMRAIEEVGVVEMIFLEVMLSGPDGFTLLNELASYSDTGRVPVVLMTELPLSGYDLSAYGVVGALSKETMRPEDVRQYVVKITGVRE